MPTYRALQRGQVFADEVTPVKRADSGENARAVKVIEPGEVFDFNGTPGSWMERVDKNEKSAEKKEVSGSAAPKKTAAGSSDGQGGDAKP